MTPGPSARARHPRRVEDRCVEWRIGCSGWSYRHWRGRFYPPDLAPSGWLGYYAARLDTVELNASHYRLPSEDTVRRWAALTPDGFRFAVKAGRDITHHRRLADGAACARFLERMRGLGHHLGPILYQLPPSFQRDEERLRAFLTHLPPDLLHVFEFRHPSWWQDPVLELLRAHRAAFCIFNMGETVTPVVATCAEAYVRLHGPGAVYASPYSDEELRAWVARLQALPGVRRVWVYFNNDANAYAPANALTMQRLARSGP
jgi:uncharacterized protein YecE (DUF72 family)